ncbi:sushi, von Willebrand factor type A, EGF and pentraxin domain-containing protein 1-like isoform X2 [Macrobrachium rosenbergii]|uniref:sushi, von Willebrand factor type A, EGF and pentraxin domain-containing protein 1-like isoform X2 n=1 Tax=Macrobrachium rosenbergii TaxID=79674 RepID=UPI0034D5F8C6
MPWLTLVALLLPGLMGEVSAQCSQPSAVGYFQWVTTGSTGILSCFGNMHDGFGYIPNYRAVIMECYNGAWNTYPYPGVTTSCSIPKLGPGNDCGTYTPPAGTSAFSIDDVAVKYLLCNDGKAWLSNLPFQIVMCVRGNWTQVLDVCLDTGDFPRDCSVLAEKGVTNATSANIAPSGSILQGCILATCSLSTQIDDSGWTLAMSYASGTYTEQEFLNGSALSTKYFLGVKTLQVLTSYRPFTFKFIIVAAGYEYATAYGSVVIENGTYSITQLGGIHGIAGDSFSQYLQQPLDCTALLCWWTSASTNASLKMAKATGINWPALGSAGMPPSKIKILVRPEQFDLAYNCPPFQVTPLGDDHTTAFSTVRRAVGFEVNFTCSGSLYYEIQENGVLSTTGSSSCQLIGGVLNWTRRFVLPCKSLPAPSNFVLSDQQDRHYNFSVTPAASFFDASERCNAMGASLATIDYISNMKRALPGILYFTAHNMRVTDIIDPPITVASECVKKNACKRKEDNHCIVLIDTGEHYAESCFNNTFHYICMIPGYCPDGYTEVKGSCYKAVNFIGSPLDSYSNCSGYDSGLMHPYSDTDIYGLLQKGAIQRNVVYTTALRTWHVGGLDTVDPNLAAQLPSSPDDQWFRFTISDNDTITYIGGPVDGGVAGTAICLYPRYTISCGTSPRLALGNVSWTWTSNLVGAVAVYSCSYGWFAGGNIPVAVQNIKCLGQLGEWYPDVQDCIHIQVCNETLTAPSNLMTNISESGMRYLGGEIVFYCPENMSTPSDLTQQTLTCSNISDTEFRFLPTVIEDCTVCLGTPLVTQGTSSLGQGPFTVGTKASAICNENYLFALNVTQKDLVCTLTGWQNASCYEACTDPPPLPGANMISQENTVASVGSTLWYNCTVDRLYIQTPSGAVASMQITCGPDHLWSPNDLVMDCVEVCLDDPPLVALPVISSWNIVTRAVGTKIDYTCPTDHFLANRELNASVTCKPDKVWTDIDVTILQCLQVVPVSPPLPPGNYSVDGNIVPYLVNQTIYFTCPAGQFTKAGKISTSITGTATGWTTLDPDFICMDVCKEDPTIPDLASNVLSSWDGVDKTVGAVVNYTCPENYLFLNKNETLTTTCMKNFTWTNAHEDSLICIEVVEVEPDLGPVGENMTITGNVKPYFVGQVVTFHCPEGQFSLAGTNQTEVIATSGGWIQTDPDFICLDEIGPPPPPSYNLILEPNRTVYVPGNQVNYSCMEGFLPVINRDFVTLTAMIDGWEPDYPPLTFFCIGKSYTRHCSAF